MSEAQWMTIARGGAVAAWLVGGTAVAAEPKVMVTIKPVHSLVAAVMAGVAEPGLLIDGTGSPHTFALKPSDAKRTTNPAS